MICFLQQEVLFLITGQEMLTILMDSRGDNHDVTISIHYIFPFLIHLKVYFTNLTPKAHFTHGDY